MAMSVTPFSTQNFTEICQGVSSFCFSSPRVRDFLGFLVVWLPVLCSQGQYTDFCEKFVKRRVAGYAFWGSENIY